MMKDPQVKKSWEKSYLGQGLTVVQKQKSELQNLVLEGHPRGRGTDHTLQTFSYMPMTSF